MDSQKMTNPKDAVAEGKLPLHLVPSTVTAYASLAFLEGAIKYGTCNWRISGVRASVYKSALERHLAKWWNGEWADEKTGVPHLASVIACAGIILDANLVDKLTDDRPPTANVSSLIDNMGGMVAHLKEVFSDYDPKHYTIHDSLPLDVKKFLDSREEAPNVHLEKAQGYRSSVA